MINYILMGRFPTQHDAKKSLKFSSCLFSEAFFINSSFYTPFAPGFLQMISKIYMISNIAAFKDFYLGDRDVN